MNRTLHLLIILSIVSLPLSLGHTIIGAAGTSPLATYQATGPPVQMYYQMINNTSFETIIQPWTLITYNNYTLGVPVASITSPGYNDNSAVQLNLNSGNLTTDSHLNLVQDFSQRTVAFASGLRLLAASQVRVLTGTSTTDRVEISLTLSSSNGDPARIHYVIASAASLPANSTRDAYIALPGLGSNLWVLLDRNVANDAASTFPTLFGSLTTVRDVRLSVFSTSQPSPTYDPRIRYFETGVDPYWNTTETVIFDPDADGVYDPATDWTLYNQGLPASGQTLSNDVRIKYVDTTPNGHWDPGEPIVYDLKNEGVYDIANNDPVINGTAVAGSLLQYPIRQQTNALFDQVELYSPTGNIDWARNGGFETGDFTGWGNTAGFKVVSAPARSGSYSANGTAAGTTVALAQSIDGRPAIDSSVTLQASAQTEKMTGASSSDKADLWLGLVDSSAQATPLSIYYYFKTGPGTIPSNKTDTVNHKAPGFGTLNKWLNLTQNLLPETQYFDATGHTGPYRIETLVIEVSSQTTSTTITNFDELSVLAASHASYYAIDRLNSTYLYNANKAPQGTFYFKIPGQQSVLNITSPTGTPLQTSDYSTQKVEGSLQITVPTTTGVKYASPGDWRIYTTSKNVLANLLVTAAGSASSSSSFNTGDLAILASQSKDPLGIPMAGSNVTFLLSQGNTIYTGRTDGQGWFNQTGVTLPASSGTVTLEAISVSSSYIGLRTVQLAINSTIPWALIAYISIAAVTGILFGLLFFVRRRRARKSSASTPPSSNMKGIPASTTRSQNK